MPSDHAGSPAHRDQPQDAHGNRIAGLPVRPFAGRGAALVVIALVCVVTSGSAPTPAKKPAGPPKIDAEALKTLVQHVGQVEPVKFPWGWIRWLINCEVDPHSKMTFGIVQIHAGQTNPLHVHLNCDELIYVLSGSCEHRIGDRTVALKAGDLLRIPAGVAHAAETRAKTPLRAVIVYNSGRRQFAVVEDNRTP